ncbi:uncharacterized protein LOC142350862 isoform X2 [Convolutriloba macropyga]|uniref:uncharacterized protein LOC142350862 isoform X2 n=1 Tax=Convolutriloba macropyga TaxID=536237 RepID=UPI003F521480
MGSRFCILFIVSCWAQLTECDSCSFCICNRDLNYIDCSSGRLQKAGRIEGRSNRVKDLFLDNNKLQTISGALVQDLMSFKSLTFLSISQNELTSFPVSVLSKIHLKTLKLSGNSLTSFSGTEDSSIIYLSLSSNKFSEVPPKLCQQFPYLNELDLSGNRISKIRTKDFEGCEVIEILYLSDNQISAIELGAFSSLVRLKILKLDGNRLTSITKNQSMFSRLEPLQQLDMSRNQINFLESLCFKGLGHLTVLNLSQNALWNMRSATFYHLKSLKYLDLSNNKLKQFKNDTLFGLGNLTSIDVSHNAIETFGGQLPLQYVQALTHLDLSFNAISKVLAVGTAPELKSLNISYNSISFIENSAFANLVSLQSLDLAHNSIHSFEKSSQIFIALTNLRSLNFSSNPIKNIPGLIFSELSPKLQYFSLRNTSLSTLAQHALTDSVFPNLRHFEVSSSNFYCDCNADWIRGWLLNKFFDASFNIICAYPEAFKGRSLLSINPKYLKCLETSARPHIVTQPTSLSVLRGQDASFSCVAKSSGTTASPSIEWTFDSKVIKKEDESEKLIVERTVDEIPTKGGQITIIMKSKVMLRNITNAQEGSYSCSVHNEFGSAYSDTAVLNVYVKPYFTLLPRNVSANINVPSVQLECAAGGDPMPDIKFNKNHNGKFPAAIEKRLNYHDGNKYYFITELKREDDGVYTCVAINPAGNVTQDFYVNVLEPPVLLQKLSNIDATIGGSVALACQSKGVPKPDIRWYRNDELLHFSKNGSSTGGFMAVEDMLVIPRVEFSHEGRYKCEVKNTVGRLEDTAIIRVFSIEDIQRPQKSDDDSGFFDWFGEGSPWSVAVGVIIIIVVCCVVVTSFIWVGILYYCKKKSRNQTYSYDRSVDGASFILRSATAINTSNLGTKQNSTSKGGESGSLSCASNSVREGETPAFGAHPVTSTTHYFQTDSPDCGPGANRIRQVHGQSYSPSAQADRHFLSGPLISSALSYDNFMGPPGSACYPVATEHSGASFNSLEMGEAFIAGPAPHPFIQSPPDQPESSGNDLRSSLSQANLRALDSSGTTMARTGANHLQEPNNVPVRASVEHSEHSTGAASDFSSRLSSDFDRGHSLGTSEHPSGVGHRNPRMHSGGLSETPSYLRHYTRFHDHNYQPNVNVMDLDDVTNLPAPPTSRGSFKSSPAVSRSSSHINCINSASTSSNNNNSSNNPNNNNQNRKSFISSDDVGNSRQLEWNSESRSQGSTAIATRATTPHGITTSASSSAVSSSGVSAFHQPIPTKHSHTRSRLPNSQSGFLTTGRIGGKHRKTSGHHADWSGTNSHLMSGSRAYVERSENSAQANNRHLHSTSIAPSKVNNHHHHHRTSAAVNNNGNSGGNSHNISQQSLRRPTASHLSEHDLRSLAVQLSVASQRETSTPPRRDPPRPPRQQRGASVSVLDDDDTSTRLAVGTTSLSLAVNDGGRNNNTGNVGTANSGNSPTDRTMSSSSSTSQHNSNS